MRIGIIGYLNNSGLGVMIQTFLTRFEVNAHLVIPNSDKGTYMHMAKAKHNRLAKALYPPEEDVDWLIQNSDVIIMIENDFRSQLNVKAKKAGVRTVFLPMYEWFDHDSYKDYDVYVCTSKKTMEFVQFSNKVYLPWPIDTEVFKFKQRGAVNRTFVHNAGFAGMNWRKGSLEAVKAFSITNRADIRLLFRSQFPVEKYPEDIQQILKNDKRIVVENRDFENSWELYEYGDVAIYSARYDGQALVAEEFMACGFPVLVTDAAPMNEFSDNQSMKIRVATSDTFKIRNNDIALCICDIYNLANKIEWCANTDLSEESRLNRLIIEAEYSWNVLHDKYLAILQGK